MEQPFCNVTRASRRVTARGCAAGGGRALWQRYQLYGMSAPRRSLRNRSPRSIRAPETAKKAESPRRARLNNARSPHPSPSTHDICLFSRMPELSSLRGNKIDTQYIIIHIIHIITERERERAFRSCINVASSRRQTAAELVSRDAHAAPINLTLARALRRSPITCDFFSSRFRERGRDYVATPAGCWLRHSIHARLPLLRLPYLLCFVCTTRAPHSSHSCLFSLKYGMTFIGS